jgi:microcystin degradation protein MlrC
LGQAKGDKKYGCTGGSKEIIPQCQVKKFANVDSTVGKGAVINIHNFPKALDVTLYKSRCKRRDPPILYILFINPST